MKKLYKLLLICLLILCGGNALKAQSHNSDNSETANRAETPTYISKIAVAYGAKESTPKDILKDKGFTIIDKDLNAGCGSLTHYIYMGYKTTTKPADAITGIYIREGSNPPNSATFDGVTAYLLGGSTEDNPGENKPVDLNIDAGGATLHVYVSRNTNLAAITDIKFSNTNSMSGYVTQNIDLNKGASGEYIYLHYKQFSGKASATFHYLNSSGSRTSSTTSVSVKHHQQAVNNTPSAPTSVTYDGRTWTLLGWREDNNATTAGSNPSYTYMDSKVYRAVYSANVSLTYNANGGSGVPSTQNATQYINAGSSSIAKSNVSITIPATIPTHDATKCNFAGWGTSSSSTTAQYQAGGSISINTNTTLYAVWTEHNGTKTYVNNGSNHTYTWSCCHKSVTEDHIYNNGIDNYCGAHIHEIDGNGYCHLCDGYPAELVNGYYEIYNADNLFWFAEYVNTIDRTASAKLMNDIDLENRPWTPIGTTGESSHNFRGHFDGNGKTITGLNVEVTRSGGGFFGEVRLGTVEDFTIYGEVKLNGNHSYVGGVIGSAPGANSNQPEHNGATIRNITSYVNVTLGEGSHGSNHVAGFIGYANHETLIENCTWYGTLDLDAYRAQDGVGGLVGKILENSAVTIRNCAAYGTIKTSYQSGSYSDSNNVPFNNIFIGGIVSNSVENAQTTLENCIWAGTLINNTNLGINAHISAIGTLDGIKSVSNCYALDNMPYITTNNAHNEGITEVTAGQLASGEIAYKLQGTQATQIWGQNIDNGETADSKPRIGGAKVYGIIYDGGGIYSNTNITAGGKCGNNLYWKVSDNTLTIFGTGAMYDYGNISNIAPWRSLNPAPKSLVLEDGITHIGKFAFYNYYGFTGDLTIPNSVTTIGDYAFENCSSFNGSLTIPNSVKSIGNAAFYECSGFTGSLTIPNSVTSIGKYAFMNCSGFNGSLTIGNSVTSIGISAFELCSGFTGSLTIGNSVKSIGDYAFYKCTGFTEVYSFAVTAPTLGHAAFSFDTNSNATLYYPVSSEQSYNNNGWFNYFSKRMGFNGKCGDNLYWYVDDENTLTIFGTGAMDDYDSSSNKAPWCSLNPAPTSLVLDEDITHIGNYAFYGCSSFTGSLTIPNSVTSIGDYAFQNCSGFTEVHSLAETAPTLGQYVFDMPNNAILYYPASSKQSYNDNGWFDYFSNKANGKCGDNLYWHVDDENTLTIFGTGAMYDYDNSGNKAPWRSLKPAPKSLVLEEGITYIGNFAFYNCSGFKGSLTIPNSVTTIGEYAFCDCYGFNGYLTIGNSVTAIGDSAFDFCEGFNGSLTIPNSVTYIGNFAFDNCSGFNGSLTIPNSVTTIGEYAFCNCEGFNGYLTIGNSVTSIGNFAFRDCSGFTGSLTIPNSVTSIGNSAFDGCSGFKGSLTIPNSVTSIGNSAFFGCYGFNGYLTIGNSVNTIGKYAFYNCKGFKGSLTIPNSVTNIGDYAFQNCSGFNGSLTIGNSVTSIGKEAFCGCSGFKGSLTIGNSVTTIKDYAFYQCSGFTGSLTIPNSVTYIGNEAFYNCSGFTDIFFYRDANPTIATSAFSYINANAKVYAPVIWESFSNIPEDKLVKMATFVGQQTTDNGQQSSSTGWVGLADGQTWPDEDDHVAINASLVLGSQQDNKTTRQQGRDVTPVASEILKVKSFGLCGNENTTNGSITIEDGGQLYCEVARGKVTVKKEILGYAETTRLQDNETTSETVWYTIASPLKDTLLISDPQFLNSSVPQFLSSNSDLYRYDEPSYTWQNAKNSANNGFNTIDPGRGYLYANANDTVLEFTGMINTNDVTYSLTTDGERLNGFHLVGNPFTHNITFAHLNATEGAELVNGYYVLNGEGAWGATLGSNEDDVIKVGQGVLVKAKTEGTLAISRQPSAVSRQRSGKGQQTTDNGQQSLCISVSNAKYSDRAFVVFDKGVGLDKMNHENEDIPLLYIPMEDADYAIAMMDMNINEIPVNFETKVMGEYTISLRQENCEFSELYLLDKETDEKVNILEQDYTFIATSSENPERFILMKDNGQQTTDNRPWVYVNNGDIVIYNIEGDANIKIFDALGRCVYQGESSDETTRIANGYSSGVYMIQKVDDNGVKVQKVMID